MSGNRIAFVTPTKGHNCESRPRIPREGPGVLPGTTCNEGHSNIRRYELEYVTLSAAPLLGTKPKASQGLIIEDISQTVPAAYRVTAHQATSVQHRLLPHQVLCPKANLPGFDGEQEVKDDQHHAPWRSSRSCQPLIRLPLDPPKQFYYQFDRAQIKELFTCKKLWILFRIHSGRKSWKTNYSCLTMTWLPRSL